MNSEILKMRMEMNENQSTLKWRDNDRNVDQNLSEQRNVLDVSKRTKKFKIFLLENKEENERSYSKKESWVEVVMDVSVERIL